MSDETIETTEVTTEPSAPTDVNDPSDTQVTETAPADGTTEAAPEAINIDPAGTYNYEHDGQVYQITGAQYLQIARTGANAILQARENAESEGGESEGSETTETVETTETNDVTELKSQIEELKQELQTHRTEQSAKDIQSDLADRVKGSDVLDFVKSLPEGSQEIENFKVQVLADMQVSRSSLEQSFKKIESQWSKLAGKSLESYLTTKVRDSQEALAPTGGRNAKPDKPLTAEDFHNGRSAKYLRSRVKDLFN